MKYFSTWLGTKEELSNYVINIEKKRLHKKIDEEKLRIERLKEIQDLENEYKQLKITDVAERVTIHC